MSRQRHERAGRLAEAAAAWHLRLRGFRSARRTVSFKEQRKLTLSIALEK